MIVVNHSLLMADAATQNRVLPEYHHLIIDEAHQLENAVTEQLSFRADAFSLAQQFAALYAPAGRASGLLIDLLALMRRGLPEDLAAILREQVKKLERGVDDVRERLGDFWDVMADVVRSLQTHLDRSDYDVRLRVSESLRNQPAWVEIEVSWENLANLWQRLLRGLRDLIAGLGDLRDGGFAPKGMAELIESLDAVQQRLIEQYSQMEMWTIKPDHNGIYWVEVGANEGRTTLRSAPLHIGPLVQEHIFFHSDTVILTSATLRTANSFDYVRDRLQAHDADTITVGSPFDYS